MFSSGSGYQLRFGGLFVCKKSFCFVWKGHRGQTLTFFCLISLSFSINTFFYKLWQLFDQPSVSICLLVFKNEVQSLSGWLSLQSWIPSCLTTSLPPHACCLHLICQLSFGSKHGEDKILLSGSLAGHWAGGCWTLQDHVRAAIVLLPFLRPGSSQIPGKLTISGLPNSIYALAPKAFKILTQQLLLKLLEGTYLANVTCRSTHRPKTTHASFSSHPQKTSFSHVGFQSNIAAFFLPAAFVLIPGRHE